MKSYVQVIGLSLLLLLFTVPRANALDFDFFGNLVNHNDVLHFNFTSADAGNVTLFSSSWATGGFDPMLGLWDSTGAQIAFQDDGGSSGSLLSNGVSYTYGGWDTYYSAPVIAGNYTVTLSTFPNSPKSTLLSDGFSYDGQAPVAIESWDQPANGFKTSNYVFHLLNVSEATHDNNTTATPEPATMVLFGLGGAGFLLNRFRQKQV